MDTIFYGALTIGMLIASAFLSAYFEDFRSRWKHRMAKVKKLERRINRNAEIQRKIVLGIPGYKENFPSKKKENTYRVNINTTYHNGTKNEKKREHISYI